jgi:hypothetical protein
MLEFQVLLEFRGEAESERTFGALKDGHASILAIGREPYELMASS